MEILLVDDGSPDNSGEICDRYAAQDARIKVIHKPNGGACEARNVGMKQTTDSMKENEALYYDCIKNMRSLLMGVLVHSELGGKTKLKMLIQGLFPVWWAKRDLRKQKAVLKADTME